MLRTWGSSSRASLPGASIKVPRVRFPSSMSPRSPEGAVSESSPSAFSSSAANDGRPSVPRWKDTDSLREISLIRPNFNRGRTGRPSRPSTNDDLDVDAIFIVVEFLLHRGNLSASEWRRMLIRGHCFTDTFRDSGFCKQILAACLKRYILTEILGPQTLDAGGPNSPLGRRQHSPRWDPNPRRRLSRGSDPPIRSEPPSERLDGFTDGPDGRRPGGVRVADRRRPRGIRLDPARSDSCHREPRTRPYGGHEQLRSARHRPHGEQEPERSVRARDVHD